MYDIHRLLVSTCRAPRFCTLCVGSTHAHSQQQLFSCWIDEGPLHDVLLLLNMFLVGDRPRVSTRVRDSGSHTGVHFDTKSVQK